MVNSVSSFVWCRTRIGIYGNVYLESRVLYAIYSMYIYVYVRNAHVHIVWYKATLATHGQRTQCGAISLIRIFTF